MYPRVQKEDQIKTGITLDMLIDCAKEICNYSPTSNRVQLICRESMYKAITNNRALQEALKDLDKYIQECKRK